LPENSIYPEWLERRDAPGQTEIPVDFERPKSNHLGRAAAGGSIRPRAPAE
jgi:hypothetical protein